MKKNQIKRSLTNQDDYKDSLKVRKKKNIKSDSNSNNNEKFDPLIAHILRNPLIHRSK